jgi:hypothetical protein
VYARSNQLVLRRHRQEVSPRVEIIFDLSQSVAISPDKLRLTTNMAALMASLAEADGLRPHIWELSAQARRLGGSGRTWRQELSAARAGGTAGLEYRPLPQLSLGAERILISDGLCPSGANAVVRALGSGAGRICLVQILRREECTPTPLGAVRLIDIEGFGGGAADIVHDEATCEKYRQRFMRHQGEWQAALSGRGAGLVTCIVEEGFDAALKRLLDRGLVEVKAA